MRFNKKLSRLLTKATLKYPHADLDEIIYKPDRLLGTTTIERLSTCGWIKEERNLLITGSTDKSYFAMSSIAKNLFTLNVSSSHSMSYSSSISTYQFGQLDGAYSHMEKRSSRYLRYALYNAAKYVFRQSA